MAKTVDRLELVADEKEVPVVVPTSEQVEELRLQPVRVLELVDHDRAKALLLSLADPRVVAQQVARAQLQILEVERRLAVLRLRVGLRERGEQLLQELAVPRGELLERRRHDRVAGFGESRRTRPTHLQLEQGEQPLGDGRGGDQVERSGGGSALCLRGALVGEQAVRRLAQRADPLGQRHANPARLEDELPSGRAERRVDLDEHAA